MSPLAPLILSFSSSINDFQFKVLLIGDSAVGKSSLVKRYTDDEYDGKFISTIGVDFSVKTIDRNGKRVKLQVWDTAGQERFRSITTSYYRNADGIILTHDLTDPGSFRALEHTWMNEVACYSSKSPSLCVVGNKADLKQGGCTQRGGAQFDIDDGQFSGLPRFEVSAKTGEGVNDMFLHITDQMMEKYHAKLRERAVMDDGRNGRSLRGISLMTSSSEGSGGMFGACCSLL